MVTPDSWFAVAFRYVGATRPKNELVNKTSEYLPDYLRTRLVSYISGFLYSHSFFLFDNTFITLAVNVRWNSRLTPLQPWS